MSALGCLQRLFDVGFDIAYILEPYGQAHVIRGHSGRELFLGIELLVGSRCRVDYQALRVPNVCQMREQLQGVDELPAGFQAALNAETDEASKSVLEVFPGVLMAKGLGKSGMYDPAYERVSFKESGNFESAF